MSDDKPLIGDITSDILRAIRADRVAKAYARITGKPCSCDNRAAKLNELHRKLRHIQTQRNNSNVE